MAQAEVRRRLGGRTAETTGRVNAAVIALLVEEGIAACTIPKVAKRAGVERSTLYRRYPDRWAMIIDVIASAAQEWVLSSGQGSFEADLQELLGKLARLLDGPLGPAVMMVAAAVKGGATPDHADNFWKRRVLQLQPMFDAAVERGEIAAGTNVEEAFALAAGPVYFRTFVSRQPVDDAFIAKIVRMVRNQYPPGGTRNV